MGWFTCSRRSDEDVDRRASFTTMLSAHFMRLASRSLNHSFWREVIVRKAISPASVSEDGINIIVVAVASRCMQGSRFASKIYVTTNSKISRCNSRCPHNHRHTHPPERRSYIVIPSPSWNQRTATIIMGWRPSSPSSTHVHGRTG